MPGINGFDMGMQFREHADKLGVEFLDAEVISLEPAEAMGENKRIMYDYNYFTYDKYF